MSNEPKSFRHKDCYVLSGEHFAVEITRHSNDLPMIYGARYRDGGNRWCVYAYIHPKHPLFEVVSEIDPEKYYSKMAVLEVNDLLHGGCSYFEKYGSSRCVKFGADYNHLGDDNFTRIESFDEAGIVEADARRLYDYLTNYKENHNE